MLAFRQLLAHSRLDFDCRFICFASSFELRALLRWLSANAKSSSRRNKRDSKTIKNLQSIRKDKKATFIESARLDFWPNLTRDVRAKAIKALCVELRLRESRVESD